MTANKVTAATLEDLGRRLARGESVARASEAAIVTMEEAIAILKREESADALEDAMIRLMVLLPSGSVSDLPAPPTTAPTSLTEEVAQLLGQRERVEHEVIGAAFLLGCALEDLDTKTPSRMLFDSVFENEVWRLVAFNELRLARLASVSRKYRRRFYWWSDGVGIHPSAVSAMTSAAHLVASFPDARKRFEALVRAQTAWDSSAIAATNAVVRTLRAFFSAPSGAGVVAAASSSLPLAAAGGDEHTVMTTSDVELSFAAPNRLIVDLLSDRRPNAVPSAQTSSGVTVVCEAVAGAEERFSIDLPLSLLDEEGATVVIAVPLASGDVQITLPPASPSPSPSPSS